MKTCRACLETKAREEFYKNRGSCKRCVGRRIAIYVANNAVEVARRKHAYYVTNRCRALAISRAWCKRNPAKNKAYKMREQARLRQEMLTAYGRRCVCCGESHEVFLTLDHVGGGGKARRAAVGPGHIYRDLRKRGWPKEGLRILCMNCNWAIRFGGTCPHVLAIRP